MFTFSVSYIVYFLFIVDFWDAFGTGLEEGDQCLFKDGSLGICKFLTSCHPALESLQAGIFPQNVCGFQGTKSIFCCKITGPVINATSASTKPTPIAIGITAATQHHSPTATDKPKLPSRTPGEISKQKCKEYAQYAYEKKHQILNIPKCVSDYRPLIIGSTPAQKSEFPHMALIGYQSGNELDWGCGGSLISENFILTAAHCLNRRSSGPAKYVRIGLTNLTDLTNMQERTISKIIPYPEYNNTKRYHDIGLLKVSENFDLQTHARPACLQTEQSILYRNAVATSWGRIEFAGPESDNLLKIILDISYASKCNKTYKTQINSPDSGLKDGIIHDLMICAGFKANLGDLICLGQFSGPLQVYREDTEDIKCMFDIVGVTSFAKCGFDAPGVYTRVSAYIKWIEDTVWPISI